jgi:hypothetical protein
LPIIKVISIVSPEDSKTAVLSFSRTVLELDIQKNVRHLFVQKTNYMILDDVVASHFSVFPRKKELQLL